MRRAHRARHAHAVELAREGAPLIAIQPQLGHSNLGITRVHLQGTGNADTIETVHAPGHRIAAPVNAAPSLEKLDAARRASR